MARNGDFLLWAELLSSSSSPVALEASDTLSVSDSADLTAGATLSAADTLSVSDLAHLLAGATLASADTISLHAVADLLSNARLSSEDTVSLSESVSEASRATEVEEVESSSAQRRKSPLRAIRRP